MKNSESYSNDSSSDIRIVVLWNRFSETDSFMTRTRDVEIGTFMAGAIEFRYNS